MDGLSPWELATLKVVYHRADRERKGFLNAEDMKRLCASLGVTEMSEEEARALFDQLDENHDGRITFRELMSYLTNNAGYVRDMQLRAGMLDQTAMVATGAAIPLILKGKTMIVLGTMFYDPVRLFRDFYVDYFHALKSKRMAGSLATRDVKSVIEGLKRGFRKGKATRATALVIFAICVDCMVGATVFFMYAKIRSYLMRFVQLEILAKQQQQQAQAQSQEQEQEQEQQKQALLAPRTRKLTQVELVSLEAVSGAGAGVFAGLIGPLAKRAVSWDFTKPTPGAFKRTALYVRHNMTAHAAFFSSFHYARNLFSNVAYKWMGFTNTTVSEAIVTTAAGCAAGGCWRIASDPFKNRDEFVQMQGIKKWRALSRWDRFAVRTRGLPTALAQTMPVTGVAFLLYEASFTLLL